MSAEPRRPHLLGVDDGPFDKNRDTHVPVVGVMTEGHDLVEAVAFTRFRLDGDDAAGFLAGWIGGLRFAAALHGVILGGISIAGLGILDVRRLSEGLRLPVMVVNRRDPTGPRLNDALRAAGFDERVAIVEKTPPAWRLDRGLWVAHAGAARDEVVRLLTSVRGKSRLPEPLRLAHLIGAAVATGESRGRP